MEAFSALLSLCEGKLPIHRRPVDSPHKSQRHAELWCFLWCAPEQSVKQSIKTAVIWAHCDVTVMLTCIFFNSHSRIFILISRERRAILYDLIRSAMILYTFPITKHTSFIVRCLLTQLILKSLSPDIKVARHIDWLVQERRNSIANALELRLSCTNPSIYSPQDIRCAISLRLK